MKSSKRGMSRRSFCGNFAALSGAALLGSCVGGDGKSGIMSDASLSPANGGPDSIKKQDIAMPKRKLGNTGLEVGVLSFGGGSSFTTVAEGKWQPLLQRAYDLGINYYDTATDYKGGGFVANSQARYGQFFTADKRKNILIGTKLNLGTDGTSYTRNFSITKAATETQLDAALKELNTDYLDFLGIHELNDGDDIDKIGNGIWQYYKAFKTAGKVRFIGFSGMDSGKKAQEFLTKLDPDICIMALSVTGYKDFSSLALPVAVQKNVGVMAIKLTKGILDAKPAKATAQECIAYGLTTCKGVSSVIIGHKNGLPDLETNATVATQIANSTSVINTSELEKRMAPFANDKHLCWAHPDYRDDGRLYELRNGNLVYEDTGEIVERNRNHNRIA
jgi:aryl-alcohol dehydrogenase-like predicted oxidoreductase